MDEFQRRGRYPTLLITHHSALTTQAFLWLIRVRALVLQPFGRRRKQQAENLVTNGRDHRLLLGNVEHAESPIRQTTV